MLSFFTTYLLALLCYLIFILYGKKKSIRQTERLLGPKSHQHKNGTITAGGVIFVSVTIFIFISKFKFNSETFFLIFPFFSFFLLGFIDDILIIKFKKNDGLKAKTKLIIEIGLSILFLLIYRIINKNTMISFFGTMIELKAFYFILFVFIFVASCNATNITDGLDGLLISLTITILLGFFIIAYFKKEYIIMSYIIILLSAMGSFYFFNFEKACLFMGDAGSLAIGALLASIAYYLNVVDFFILVSLPLIWEVLSVIIQVLYFKLTNGKRIFKMAPFHHHLEALGYSEKFIKMMFLLTETILVLVGLSMLGVIK